MKNHSLSILTIALSVLLLSSCEKCIKGSGNIITVERTVPSFEKIRVNGNFKVFIRQDAVQKVEVSADDNITPLIKTQVKSGVLEIETSSGDCIRKSTKKEIYISIPLLKAVELDGSGEVRSTNKFTGQDLELEIEGSGLMSFQFDGNSISGRIGGSGYMDLDGTVYNSIFNIDGSGNIAADQVISEYGDAQIEGSGRISLHVNTHLDAKINGSGNISYSGSPKVNVNVSGSGHVTKN